MKSLRSPLGLGENKRPDFQELLTDVRLAVYIRDGEAEEAPSLAERLAQALASPSAVTRFGGLALGESTHLVDVVRDLREDDAGEAAAWLVRDPMGHLSLPIWPDHVGSAGTRFEQFSLVAVAGDLLTPPSQSWTAISPP